VFVITQAGLVIAIAWTLGITFCNSRSHWTLGQVHSSRRGKKADGTDSLRQQSYLACRQRRYDGNMIGLSLNGEMLPKHSTNPTEQRRRSVRVRSRRAAVSNSTSDSSIIAHVTQQRIVSFRLEYAPIRVKEGFATRILENSPLRSANHGYQMYKREGSTNMFFFLGRAQYRPFWCGYNRLLPIALP
jgi:hypothetical protein